MKKLLVAAILVVCSATLGHAAWSGMVVWAGQGVRGATVTTNPADGVDTTPYSGCFYLSEAEGMQQDTFYYWLKGYKAGIGDGYYYINRKYDRDEPIGGIYIYLDTAGK